MKYRLITLLFCVCVDSLRILSVFPSATRSHYLSVRPILLELLNRGHEVVSVSPFEEGSRPNYTWIEVEVKNIFDSVPKLKDEIGRGYSFFGYLHYVWRTMNTYVTYITERPKLAGFMRNDTSNFDLILTHDFFQPIFYTFAHKYKAPLITMSTFGHAHYIHNYMDGHFDFTHPHEFSNLEHPLNYPDSFRNFIYVLYDIFGRKIHLFKYQNSLVSKLFGFEDLDLEDLERNTELVLINSYFATSSPRANMPHIVEVGGVHIERPRPLNQKLQKILDGATDGAILLSLGSILDLSSQDEIFVTTVLNTLASLKQRVILKWNSHVNISGYKNIYSFPWLPQNDILAHPNIKLFINHGGGLSNHETVFHGVPGICIPLQANQHQVCHRSVKLGYAIHVSKDQILNRLNESIQMILSDGSFKKNVLEASKRFKDRPVTALDTAVFWIEFCARNGYILRKNVKDMTVAIVLVWLTITIVILYFIVKRKNDYFKVKKC